MLALVAVSTLGPVALLFAGRFRLLYRLWGHDDNYSHGYFVPIVSAYLAAVVVMRQGLPGQSNHALGMLVVGLGCLLRLRTVPVAVPGAKRHREAVRPLERLPQVLRHAGAAGRTRTVPLAAISRGMGRPPAECDNSGLHHGREAGAAHAGRGVCATG